MLDRDWIVEQLGKISVSSDPLASKARELASNPALRVITSGMKANAHDMARQLRRRVSVAEVTGTKLLGVDHFITTLEAMPIEAVVDDFVLAGDHSSLLAVSGHERKLLGYVIVEKD